MKKLLVFLACALAACSRPSQPSSEFDKLTYHNNPQRTGWNAKEGLLTPGAVGGPSFGLLWETPRLDAFNSVPPRLFATPLYVDAVQISSGPHAGGIFSVVYVVTSTGFAYAVNAFQAGKAPPGEILWRKGLSEDPCSRGTRGNLSTPIIDSAKQRLYVTSCSDRHQWQAHALDMRSGETLRGWPVDVNAVALNAPGMNRNGPNKYPERLQTVQRGALNLSPDRTRLYLTFGEGDTSGWIVALDTENAAVASAFSVTASPDEWQGGVWSSGGPAIDRHGNIYVATGANDYYTKAGAGFEGMFPNSTNSWGQSILKLADSPQRGLQLVGTYTPFNFCQTGLADIDLGSSGAVLIDLEEGGSSTPHILALGGAKQGNAYLLDRDNMPGDLIRRKPCSDDPSSDLSLLPPAPQPHFGKRGPLNVFVPYSETHGLIDQAKSRTTMAWFRDRQGTNYLFVVGSSKTGENLTISVPPGLARLRIVTTPGEPAYLQLEQLEQTQTFHNPGSPVITSAGDSGPIVWLLDMNAPKSTSLYDTEKSDAPRPVLYAFDALDFRLLWKTRPGELPTSGKYNEPTIVRGTVFVGTDRLHAYGLRSSQLAGTRREELTRRIDASKTAASLVNSAAESDHDAQYADGKLLFDRRCASCHDLAPAATGIPSRKQLALLPVPRIVEALTYGAMQDQAFGLSDRDVESLAVFLTESSITEDDGRD